MFHKVRAFSLFLCLWLFNSTLATFATIPTAKPGCPTKCGDVAIYYPFGIGLDGSCSLTNSYNIYCNNSFTPHKPFLNTSNLEVIDMSITGKMRTRSRFAIAYYQNGEKLPNSLDLATTSLIKLPLVFSDTENKLTLIGCDDFVILFGTLGRTYRSGCIAGCSKPGDVINGSCSGIGCCQTSIPKGLISYEIDISSFNNHTNVSSFNPYSVAFIGEQDKFDFNVADLDNPLIKNGTKRDVPVVVEWFVGVNQTCRQAMRNQSSYACQANTYCVDFDEGHGYRCSCLHGYEGNPYLSPGCTDINECGDIVTSPCSNTAICTNIPGSYKCSCPKGYHGDVFKNGTNCTRPNNPSQFVTRLSLGLSLGFLSLVLPMSWICFIMIRRNHDLKMKMKFFEQNGGVLLKQQLSRMGGSMECSKIFSADELKVATNNYSEDCIVGKGGNGVVYKGILKNGCEVAIKKSKVVDQIQVEHFINEVIILTQINHRNVVKLLGCCLETEVPLLVYEFISNGTLFEHIHKNKGITSWLTWATCIRLASEAADALMYLHSAASIPIIHRDVKSTNILLDESYTTKISDFGASRLVPIDQEQVTTLVQGTMGYLDPEYLHSSQLTEKSDVYSFGVVLAELLTKEKPLSSLRKIEERNLSTYFVLAIKEDRLMEILDNQLVREATEDQLRKMAKLVKECLNVKGEDRPTMKEVALELEELKKQNRHPWAHQNEDTINFVSQQDLYPIYPPNDEIGSATSMELSGQYSMEMSLISNMNNPR